MMTRLGICTRVLMMCIVICTCMHLINANDNRQREQTRGNGEESPPRGRLSRGRVTSRGKKMTSRRGGVQEIAVPMCSHFLPYNVTKLPNSFGHKTQAKIYNKRLERLWSSLDSGCSANLRLLACSLYLPKYDAATGQSMGPCKSTCKEAKRRCKGQMKRWPKQFRCRKMPKDESTCLTPLPSSQFQPEHAFCVPHPAPLCHTTPYLMGSLPNIFFQSSLSEIRAEIQHYEKLVTSGCSRKAAFFLCGTFMPYCIHSQFRPFAMPCREVCEEVYRDCSATYETLYRGLPWPTKLRCDRFPVAMNTSASGAPDACVMS